MGLGALQQLVSLGPQDLTINPSLQSIYGPEAFTNFIKDNKYWLLIGLIILLSLGYIFIK